MNAFLCLVARDLRLSIRDGGSIGVALGFYLVVIAILPLGIGPDLKLLGRIAPGLLWVGLLLSALLSVDRIFQQDHEDGSLELLALGPLPLELVVTAKCFAHWLSTGLPLVLMAPLLGLMLNLNEDAFLPLMATMAIGTLAISFLGGVGASLTLGLKKGGLLISLLILPFFIPILIFGVSAVMTVIVGPGSFWPPFQILCAITLGTLATAPFFAAMGLRMNLS